LIFVLSLSAAIEQQVAPTYRQPACPVGRAGTSTVENILTMKKELIQQLFFLPTLTIKAKYLATELTGHD